MYLLPGKWEEVRKLYHEQIAGLEGLDAQVKEGLEHLRLETSYLQSIEDTIRQQREVLDVGFQEFERKHALFQEKGWPNSLTWFSRKALLISGTVQQALTEANDAFTKHAPSRDLEPINERS